VLQDGRAETRNTQAVNYQTLATEIINESYGEIIFKLEHEYAVKGVGKLVVSKTADNLMSLTLDDGGNVKYHKDM
jgi:hypothetical protein